MVDGYNAQSGQVLSWNGNGGGQWITVPINTNNWVPGQIVYTITGVGGGGGGSITQAVSGDEPKPEEKKKDSSGCSCKKCKEFFPYAEPNQKDGTLICWSCRHGY